MQATFTENHWLNCLKYFNNRCAYCDRPQGLWHTLAQDHVVPITKGGEYTPSNIVPACHGQDGCNNSKSSRNAAEWLTERYGKHKARQILKRIQTYFDSLK